MGSCLGSLLGFVRVAYLPYFVPVMGGNGFVRYFRGLTRKGSAGGAPRERCRLKGGVISWVQSREWVRLATSGLVLTPWVVTRHKGVFPPPALPRGWTGSSGLAAAGLV